MRGDFESHRIGEVFKSRKNRVFRIRTDSEVRVAKVYPRDNVATAKAEFDLLTRCFEHHLPVPTPIELADDTIVMSYLEGPTVSEIADSLLTGGKVSQGRYDVTVDSLAKGLADWLASFHVAFDNELCRGDTILRNFVLSNGRVFGLDFEEAHEGDPILDLGELCANVLGMRPLFSRNNFELASDMLSSYWRITGEDRKADISDAIAVGLEHYARFRQDGGVLQEWARKFREEGSGLLEQPLSKI